MKLRPVSLAALALLTGLAASAQAQERKPYIVQLTGEPVATYAGTVQGYAATAPAAGRRLDIRSAAAQSYISYLDAKQDSVLALVGNAPVTARYKHVINGFAAQLTDAEVLALRANPQVIEIQADEARELDTISTSKFLGLTAPGGVWSQSVNGLAVKGEDVIVGVLDSGVWPDNPAYADKVDATGKPTHGAGTQVYGPPPAGWAGVCTTGPGFSASDCNNKLIGARVFNEGFKANAPALHWTDFADSPRDSIAGAFGHGGHGSHTSSTAAGNSNVPATINGAVVGSASGMAPRARIAAYKVCWTYVNAAATDGTGSQNTCYNSDSVAAIDQAVADGVNVINYSISGSQTSINDPVEQAFHRAALAGIFVAVSAGNSGPGNQVAHISPWLTTVAASTHDRDYQGSLTLGNGTSYTGGSTTTVGLPVAKQLILAENAGIAGASANLKLCYSSPNELDPVKVFDKIVVCTRGTNARVDKGQAVKDAGGAGMILVNPSANTVDSDFQAVPTVQMDHVAGAAIKAYAGTAGAKATIAVATMTKKAAPLMASFSSRGPNKGDANILKPDLTAPGVDIIAAVTANLTQEQKDQLVAGTLVPPTGFDSYQGTSMSSPHVAGLAALLKQAHPAWSPAAIKSALMTSAYSTLDDGLTGGQNGLLPWSQGAGHVDPNKAIDPGLVYDSGKDDWIRYQCKVNRTAVSQADCAAIGTLDETYNLNLASITIANVVGAANVVRRVTNVGTSTATYTATASVPGFKTTVIPASLTLAAGETKSFVVNIEGAGAADNVWQFGSLSWSDGTHVVKSPVSLRTGKAILAPDGLTMVSTSGSRLITVRTGFSGKLTANKGGLKAATMSAPVTLTPGSMDSTALKAACVAGVDRPNMKVHTFTVPAGTVVARFALRQQDVTSAGDDFDFGVLSPDMTTFNYSGNDGSNESVQLVNPVAGTYRACVVAFGAGTGQTTMRHSLSSWIVTPADIGGKFNVALPGAVTAGVPSTVGFSWSGLVNGERYLGGIQFKDSVGNVQAATIVTVEPNAVPQATPAKAPSAKELSKLD